MKKCQVSVLLLLSLLFFCFRGCGDSKKNDMETNKQIIELYNQMVDYNSAITTITNEVYSDWYTYKGSSGTRILDYYYGLETVPTSLKTEIKQMATKVASDIEAVKTKEQSTDEMLTNISDVPEESRNLFEKLKELYAKEKAYAEFATNYPNG